jgi:hypothetical protein
VSAATEPLDRLTTIWLKKEGSPEDLEDRDSFTSPEKPLILVIEIVEEPDLPCEMLRD